MESAWPQTEVLVRLGVFAGVFALMALTTAPETLLCRTAAKVPNGMAMIRATIMARLTRIKETWTLSSTIGLMSWRVR